MYICRECELVFNSPKQYSEDCTPYGGPAEPGFSHTHYGCPSCGSSYDETMRCARCDNEYVSVESKYPFCEGCLQDLITVFCEVMADNFREDEYDAVYDLSDGMSYQDIINKKEGKDNEDN